MLATEVEENLIRIMQGITAKKESNNDVNSVYLPGFWRFRRCPSKLINAERNRLMRGAAK